MTSSVLIPSFQRASALHRCLEALAKQTRPADEVLVVWQADDESTRDAAEADRALLGPTLKIIHSPEAGVVPSENAALAAATGEVVLLIDDDAVAPPDWVEKHLLHYADPQVGAVGGPSDNFHHHIGNRQNPIRSAEPCGRLGWSGRAVGNMYDQPLEWRSRSPVIVDHLVGNNMSLRRSAFDEFEADLRPYWQMFELDACLQVTDRGFKVIFDYSNVVSHYPTNTAFQGGRHGDLEVKVFNPAYNHAFVMSKHVHWSRRLPFLIDRLAVGNVGSPGVAAAVVASMRYGDPRCEARILLRTIAINLQGWRDGARKRDSQLT
jgi:GT2 family glycosyltransferase